MDKQEEQFQSFILGNCRLCRLRKRELELGLCVLKGDGVVEESWGQGRDRVPAEGDTGLCFREAYPNCTVLEARPCYNVARLMFLDAER